MSIDATPYFINTYNRRSFPPRQITQPIHAKLPNKLAPNCPTNPRQIAQQILAKLPNKSSPNYRICRTITIFAAVMT
ncbi:MAG: hypothetical protein LUC24_05880, partial [Bacteroidales bacterium]|nr:hypothetical protein [Bacteroidales bacterium]